MKLLTPALIVSKIIGVTFSPLQCFLIISDTDITKGNNKQTIPVFGLRYKLHL